MAADALPLDRPAAPGPPRAGGLRPVRARGRTAGLANLLRRELGAWARPRSGLAQCLLWLTTINGLMVLALWVIPRADPDETARAGGILPLAVAMFFQTVPLITGIGAVILAHNAIVGERQLGTAAWILSKPVSRAAFVLAKLLSLAAGTVATITLLQGAVFSLLVAAATGTLLPPRPFVAGLALVQLSILFYLTLTLMLGVLFRSRGPVIGIPLAILLMQQIVRTVAPAAALVMPETLGFIGAALALGMPVPTYLPVAAVVLCCALFTAVAVWRFGREEL